MKLSDIDEFLLKRIIETNGEDYGTIIVPEEKTKTWFSTLTLGMFDRSKSPVYDLESQNLVIVSKNIRQCLTSAIDNEDKGELQYWFNKGGNIHFPLQLIEEGKTFEQFSILQYAKNQNASYDFMAFLEDRRHLISDSPTTSAPPLMFSYKLLNASPKRPEPIGKGYILDEIVDAVSVKAVKGSTNSKDDSSCSGGYIIDGFSELRRDNSSEGNMSDSESSFDVKKRPSYGMDLV